MSSRIFRSALAATISRLLAFALIGIGSPQVQGQGQNSYPPGAQFPTNEFISQCGGQSDPAFGDCYEYKIYLWNGGNDPTCEEIFQKLMKLDRQIAPVVDAINRLSRTSPQSQELYNLKLKLGDLRNVQYYSANEERRQRCYTPGHDPQYPVLGRVRPPIPSRTCVEQCSARLTQRANDCSARTESQGVNAQSVANYETCMDAAMTAFYAEWRQCYPSPSPSQQQSGDPRFKIHGTLDESAPVSVTLKDFIDYALNGQPGFNPVQTGAYGVYPIVRDVTTGKIVKNYRYVQTPGHPDAIIDMRHFQFVGPLGQDVGSVVERIQGEQGLASAYDRQDFYSNALGEEFRNYYNSHFTLNYADNLQSFFGPQNAALINTAIQTANALQ